MPFYRWLYAGLYPEVCHRNEVARQQGKPREVTVPSQEIEHPM